MFKILILVCAFFASSIALGQVPATEVIQLQPASAEVAPPLAPAAQPPEFINKTEPDYTSTDALGKLMSILAALYMGMWTLGEILTRVSVWTENKWDNKLAAYVSQATWFVGAFCGRMGWKLPKLVIEHEAEKIAAKKSSTSSDNVKV